VTTPQPHTRARQRLTREQYVEGILRGDRTVLARAITLVESTRPEHARLAGEVIEACLPRTGRAVRVGVTGPPGAGKSTFIEALGLRLTREMGRKVAVLAVDPSSRISRGSVLGDKTRMAVLSNEPEAFIRPSPSGGSLGGVARRTREIMLLCEAAGYGTVLVETVGVGQSETAVRGMVDFFLLLLLPGAGDELQGMKRGVMEMADLIAINKADIDRRRAEIAHHEFMNALQLLPPPETGWQPRAVTCSAVSGEGIAEIWRAVLEHRRILQAGGMLERLRREQEKSWMRSMLEEGLLDLFRQHPLIRKKLPEFERDVLRGRITAFRAVEQLLELYRKAAS
jgi:LAO/AO transport system kinase